MSNSKFLALLATVFLGEPIFILWFYDVQPEVLMLASNLMAFELQQENFPLLD